MFKCILTDFGFLRTIEINGAKWFVVADVCKMIGYKDSCPFIKVVNSKELKKIEHGYKGLNIVTTKGLTEFFELNNKSYKANFKPVRKWFIESNLIPNYTNEDGSNL